MQSSASKGQEAAAPGACHGAHIWGGVSSPLAALGRDPMLDLDQCLSALYRFARRTGASVDYAELPGNIGGCLDRGRILLSPDLAPEQELLTLVHELTHVMAHIASARSRTERTVCEYEAEAVEGLIAQRLGFESSTAETWNFPDGLLADSVARVGAVASTLLAALDREPLAGFTP